MDTINLWDRNRYNECLIPEADCDDDDGNGGGGGEYDEELVVIIDIFGNHYVYSNSY